MNKISNYLLGKDSSFAYSINTLLLAVIPESGFKCINLCESWSDATNVLVNRLILCFLIFSLSKAIYGFYVKNRKKVVLKCKNYSIQIEYGDIIKINDGKKVINFDECFTTKIGESPADIKTDSVCGQYLTEHQNVNIINLIAATDVKPAKGKSQYNNQERYEPGTLIPNGDDLLMSFAKLDKNGRAYLTYEEYLECLKKLWEQIAIYRGTKDIYVPILGSFITNLDKNLTQQELLKIMIYSYMLSPNKVKEPNKLHIVCRPREGFSINSIFELD